MVPRWAVAVVAKAKPAAMVATALAAGGVGGSVALNHVAPAAHSPRTAAHASSDATATSTATPSGTSARSESAPATQHPSRARASLRATDPPDPADAATQAGGSTGGSCPADTANHGDAVSGTARTGPATGASQGTTVRQQARSDCGKPHPRTQPAAPAPGHPQETARTGDQPTTPPHSTPPHSVPPHSTTTHPTKPAAPSQARSDSPRELGGGQSGHGHGGH